MRKVGAYSFRAPVVTRDYGEAAFGTVSDRVELWLSKKGELKKSGNVVTLRTGRKTVATLRREECTSSLGKSQSWVLNEPQHGGAFETTVGVALVEASLVFACD